MNKTYFQLMVSEMEKANLDLNEVAEKSGLQLIDAAVVLAHNLPHSQYSVHSKLCKLFDLPEREMACNLFKTNQYNSLVQIGLIGEFAYNRLALIRSGSMMCRVAWCANEWRYYVEPLDSIVERATMDDWLHHQERVSVSIQATDLIISAHTADIQRFAGKFQIGTDGDNS